jgi:hypothetical protein
MKINKEWHEKNKMPKNPSFDQRVRWHLEHQKNCACGKGIPKNIGEELKRRNVATLENPTQENTR